MANLSNINGKFVVEQTTGYVGIGNTDPAFPLEVKFASAELALNATGASIYRLKSDSTDYFRINKNGVGDRLVISGGGDVGIGTSSPVTLKSATTLQVLGNIKAGAANGSGLISLGDIASTGANAGIWRGAAGAYAGVGNWLNIGGYDGITFTTGNTDIASQTERMRITSAGNVLITSGGGTFDTGALSGSAKGVNIQQTVPIMLVKETATNNRLYMGMSGALGFVGSPDNISLRISTSDTSRIEILSGGNVGIGTTSPSYLLHVDDAVATDPSYIVASSGSDFVMAMGSQNSPGVAQEAFIGTLSNQRFKIKVNNVDKGTWTSTGLGIGTAGPYSPLEVVAPTTKTNLGTVSNQTITCSGGGGVGEYNQIGFGYTAGDWSPAVIGYITTNGAVSTLGALIFATRNSTTASAPTERMRINSSGNVGIGTDSPGTQLEIKAPDTTGSPARTVVTRQLTLNANGGNSLQPYEGFGTGIIFEGYDYAGGGGTSGPRDYAYIDSIIENSGSTPVDFRSQLKFHTNPGGSSTQTPTVKMVIEGGGNVGIGTTSPGEKLTIASGGKLELLRGANDRNMTLYTDNSYGTIETDVDPILLKSAHRIGFHCNGSERVRFDENGNVGINTTSGFATSTDLKICNMTSGVVGAIHDASTGTAGGRLTICGQNYSPQLSMRHYSAAYGFDIWVHYSANWDTYFDNRAALSGFRWRTNTENNGGEVQVAHLNKDGDLLIAGTLTENSDISLKENIKPLESQLEIVDKLNPISYNKIGRKEKEIGFIAQEVEKLLPDLVNEDEDGLKSLSYTRMTAVLVKSIQELKAEIDILKNK